MFNRLVGRSVLAQADTVMGHDIDRAHAHQCRQANGVARIVRKHQKRAAIGDQTAMHADAIHRRRHAEFAHAVADIVARLVPGELLIDRGHPGQI